MAFPYIGEEGFEDGTLGIFDSETDTAGKLDFPSYKELARNSRVKAAPYRGAYCMRVDLANTPGTSAYVVETDDLAADAEQSIGFMLYVSPDIVMANNDEFAVYQLLATTTDEGSIVINYTTANGLRIGLESPSETNAYTSLMTGRWIHVALDIVIDAGGGNDGSLTLYIDGTQVAQLTTIDQGAITDARLGAINLDAGTTAGTLLFDHFIADNATVKPPAERFPENLLITKSGNAFVGPGRIENVSLISGNANDCTLIVYDTDEADTTDEGNIVVYLANTASGELVDPAAMPVSVNRGAYVSLAGTNPRALVKLGRVVAYSSDGAIRNYGAKV